MTQGYIHDKNTAYDFKKLKEGVEVTLEDLSNVFFWPCSLIVIRM